MPDLAAAWFSQLRERLCQAFEALEDALDTGPHAGLPPGRFVGTAWDRPDHAGGHGGGGIMSIMRGRVFEKVGVNISTVMGTFSPEFSDRIAGAKESGGRFFATGISVVAHMRSPLVPAVHMNTRYIETSQKWFGGGADITPMFPDSEDSKQDAADFHAALKKACDRFDTNWYPHYKEWCDRYFYLPHRTEARGLGGIFFDNLNTGNQSHDFDFTQAVGLAFLDTYPMLVDRRMRQGWSETQREQQLIRRGRYVEFNLLYDRGTAFGLKTGGNTEAILMSLPPEVRWP